MFFVASLFLVFLDSHQPAPEHINLSKLALANNKLAIKLHKTYSYHGNVVISPVSVFTALGMLYTGAKGETAQEIRHALSYNTAGLSDKTINQQFQELLLSFSEAPDGAKLEIANAMVTQMKYPILDEYKEKLINYYGAIAKEMDFSNHDEAVNEINSWVDDKTHGKISKLLESLDPDTVLVLLNAVYFRGTWKMTFNPIFTKEGTFYNNGNTTISVPMMVQENDFFFGTFREYGAQALKLSYLGDKISMIILLPFKKDGLRTVEESLTATTLDNIVSHLREEHVIAKLPKFKIEDSRELKENLQRLGMKLAFTDGADLSGISEEVKLKVSKVVHKSMIEVNEAGTKAAGVTAIVVQPYILKETSFFTVDHPFLFFIRDDVNGMILFSGRVNEL